MKFFLEPGWMHSDFDSVVVVDDDSFIPWLWIDSFVHFKKWLIVLARTVSLGCDWINLVAPTA